jgi:ABC-type enterobactin transport system permease subunit
MGFNTGAWSGVLVAMVLFGQNLTAIALAAMGGRSRSRCARPAARPPARSAPRRPSPPGRSPSGSMLVAFNTWLLLRASLETALSAGLWNAGSLNGLTWEPAGRCPPASTGSAALTARFYPTSGR